MSTIVSKLLGHIPSTAVGMLWSLGLHAAAFAATYTWWTSPIAPVSFAGSRYAVQFEMTFSEMPPELETETVLEFEPVPPPDDLRPADPPELERELVVALPTLPLPDMPLRDDEANEIVEVKPPPQVVSPKESHKIDPIETPTKPLRKPTQPPTPETAVAVEQFAGVEDQSPPDLSGNRPPSYPPEAIRRREKGIVLLRLTIAISGQIERVEVAKSSGHAILDRAAVKAVSTWRARPAKQEGTPVASVELLPVHFNL
ncbi:MAG: energy transducer TonB [Planctomycetes bacterium]|nr:energy transducer TonB [Planctomycetota bacterium]